MWNLRVTFLASSSPGCAKCPQEVLAPLDVRRGFPSAADAGKPFYCTSISSTFTDPVRFMICCTSKIGSSSDSASWTGFQPCGCNISAGLNTCAWSKDTWKAGCCYIAGGRSRRYMTSLTLDKTWKGPINLDWNFAAPRGCINLIDNHASSPAFNSSSRLFVSAYCFC